MEPATLVLQLLPGKLCKKPTKTGGCASCPWLIARNLQKETGWVSVWGGFVGTGPQGKHPKGSTRQDGRRNRRDGRRNRRNPGESVSGAETLRLDGGGPGGEVEQGQLSKAAALADGAHLGGGGGVGFARSSSRGVRIRVPFPLSILGVPLPETRVKGHYWGA